MCAIDFVIIIPVYNAAPYLERAVASVTGQEYQRWTIILSDDGSTDASPALCDRLEQEDDRIIALHQPNEGQLSARVNGIRCAQRRLDTSGSYYLFLDADDAFKPDALQRIAQIIREQRCDMLIFGIEEHPRIPLNDRAKRHAFEGAVTDRAQLYRIVLYDYQYNSLCRKAIAASLVHDRDFSDWYGFRHGEDLLQSMDYYRLCQKAFFTHEVFYTYYQNAASVTKSRSIGSFPYKAQVRALTWEMLTAEHALSEADRKAYATFNCRLLRSKIISLCTADAPAKEIIPILIKMQQEPFYQTILADNSDYDRVIRLFVRKKYDQLIRYCRLSVGVMRLLGK